MLQLNRHCRVFRLLGLTIAFATPALSAHELETPTAIQATERRYFFERAGRLEDMAQNTVNALLQDHAGFIWIGTQGGLHRYDGYEFVRFQHRPDQPDSLPDSFITALAEDQAGNLYVGTNRRGLVRRDPDSNRFEPVQQHLTHNIRQRTVSALLADPARGLWIGSQDGLALLDAQGQRHALLGSDALPARSQAIADLSLCPNGDLWAAANTGLYRVAAGTRNAERFADPDNRAFSAVFCTPDNKAFAGAQAEVLRVDGNRIERVWPNSNSEADARPGNIGIADIIGDSQRRIWVAVRGAGLLLLSRDGKPIEWMQHHTRVPGSLLEDSVRTLLHDDSGLLWVGGDVHGLARTDPQGATFTYLFDPAPGRNEIASNNVRALLPDGLQGLWIGTEGDSLKHYNFVSREIRTFAHVLRVAMGKDAPQDLRVFAIRRASQPGLLWVASNRGVFRFDPLAGTASRIGVAGAPADADLDARSLIVARDGHLWIGTLDNGVVRQHPDTGQWQRLQPSEDGQNGLWHPMVLALHEDRSGRVWIGTLSGLNVYEPNGERLLRIAKRESDDIGLAGDLVRTVIEGSDGRIWIGTHNGLNRLRDYRGEQSRFDTFQLGDGLVNDTIYGVVEDELGHVWISTNGGVSRIDTETRAIQNFGLQDGLQGLEFNGGAYARLPDGRIAFGGTQGLNFFDPGAAEASRYQPRLAFTSYQVGNRQELVLQPTRFNKLTLPPGERVLMLSFAAFDFAAPERNQFEYQLLGLNDKPVALGPRHELTLTNLAPGHYPLTIRGSNHDRVFANSVLSLDIEVRPTWWQDWPARLAGLLLAALLIAVTLRRRRRIRNEMDAQHEQQRIYSERLSLALWASRDGFWDWDRRARTMAISGPSQFAGITGEATISEHDWETSAVHPDDVQRVRQALIDHCEDRTDHYEAEYRVRIRDGRYLWIMARGRAVARDEQGQVVRVAGTFRDISEARERDRDQRIAREVITSMSEAVSVTDLEFCFVSINPAFTRITGYQPEEVVGHESSLLDSEQHPHEFYDDLRRGLVANGHWSGELWQRRKDGEQFLAWLEMSEVCDANGARTHWVAVLTDITDRKRAEQELRYLANYDTLTGLPNRTLLSERLAHSLIRARRFGAHVAVLFLDLDRFKHVNDSMGHAAGDRLLKAVAARIVTTVRESDTVARLGGDEFTVVLEDLHDIDEAEKVARKLLSAFEVPLDVDGRHELVISPSIGISLYPEHGQVPTDLLKHADTAMYYAKERGRNTYQFYNDAMDAKARLRANMANQLHKALERGELSLVFQPKMTLSDRRITGAEALLRWHNPTLGMISPTEFIPVAEETGLIVPIGEWVIKQACMQLKRWTEAGLTTPTIAVNVSALQLFRGELAKRLREILDDMRVPAYRLELELTESMLMANPEQSIATLTQIKALGLRLAIDDFGTGYSSLAYLKRLPIDTLKIDKAFVADLGIDADDEAITTTVIMMAHAMGLDVIAEGVETNEQLRFLSEQNCDEIQGHLISAPMEADRMLQFLLGRDARALE